MAALLASIALGMGCGGADEHPLGGPYGGTVSGSESTSNGGNPQDDSGTANADDSGSTGTPPPPGVDASAPPPGVDAGSKPGSDASAPPADSGSGPAAPTWSSIYSKYFASGTVGRCTDCHGQASSASNLYSWMKSKGYINGTGSSIVSTAKSDISWFGGSMPPNGPTSEAAATSDMKAWVAAGAANN